MNKMKFKAKVIEKGMTMEQVAERIGMNRATLSRKINGLNQFTGNEITNLAEVLDLRSDEVMEIFFSQLLANTQ